MFLKGFLEGLDLSPYLPTESNLAVEVGLHLKSDLDMSLILVLPSNRFG